MKKTMFLVALMGAALCSNALAATTYSWDSTTNTTTVTPDGGSAVVYSGSVYTWTGTNATASGANSWNYVSDAEGGTTATIAWNTNGELQNPGNGYHALANNGNGGSATSGNFNTLHFTGSTNNKGAKFDFEPLVIAGVIVDEGATGYSMTPNRSDRSRTLYIGNANTTAAHSSIQEDFTLSSSASATTGYAFNVRGTQTWDIASNKTFTLNSGTAVKTISGALSILGGGTASFTGTGITTIAAGTTIDVASGSTLALAGTVNVAASEADIVAGTETAKTEGNGFGTAQYSRVVYTGEGTLSGDVTWQYNGSTEGTSYDASTHTITGEGNSLTYYINDASAEWNEGSAKIVEVNVGDNTLALAGGKSLNVETLHIKSGRVETQRSNATGVVTGDIIVDGGATLAVTGDGQDAFGYSGYWGGNYTDAISLNGTDANHMATLELSHTATRTVTMSTNLNLNGYSQVTTSAEAKRGFNTFGTKITADKTNNVIAANLDLRQTVEIEVKENAELLISGTVSRHAEASASSAITKTGDGTLTISGDITGGIINGDGSNTSISSASITNATLNSVSLTDAAHSMSNVTLGGTTTANGTLTTTGTTTIAAASTVTVTGTMTAENLAVSGSLELAQTELTVSSVTLNSGAAIELTDPAGKLTTSAMTVNGNATINADLVFAENSTITFTAGSVTLGSSIKFGENSTVALGTAYVEDMSANGQVLLFSGVDGLDPENLKNVTVTIGDVAGILKAEVQNDGSYNIYATPEPATTTLSLLALAGLMARRKRH